MASVWKRGGRKGKGPWMITFSPEPNGPKTVRGFSDIGLTRQLANKLEDDARARRMGLIDAKAERLLAGESKPLADHLADYKRTLEAKGSTAEHVRRTEAAIVKLLTACGFTCPADLDGAKLAEWVAQQREAKAGARAINAKLTAIKGFARWLVRTERMRTDPLAAVAKLNARTDKRHQRRALSEAELALLVETAAKGGDVLGMSGHDRAMLYRVAVGTGLRAAELASLTRSSFNLDDPAESTVTVLAAYSKHRRDDTLPLSADLACAVATFTANRPAGQKLFNVPAGQTARMIRADLAAARDAWLRASATAEEAYERFSGDFLAYADASGHLADFHSLRHAFASRLAKAGVTPAVAKALMRHSSIELTMGVYTHTYSGDTRSAVDSLRPILPEPNNRQAVKATGTDHSRASEATDSRAAPGAARSIPQLAAPVRAWPGNALDDASQHRAQSLGNSAVLQENGREMQHSGPLAQRLEQGTHNHSAETLKPNSPQDLRVPPTTRAAPATQTGTPEPDLAEVINAWPSLPAAVKAGILATIRGRTW